ncbi:MAG: prolipoprotein diacylglyceryl transferase [Verrucomicrobia bacterium GWF2_51_19]|nr:MAG: prolipoprotein diacylglyceryl transferase [Verrucomicrobia bacterium GWF2_51_19]HCJ12129.1 prolipoprotein diacylglyceryl transferase [Opitutae bacterium]
MHYIHNIDPFLIKFPEYFVISGIRWYGVAYLVGFLVGWGLLGWYRREGRVGWTKEVEGELLSALVVGVLVGGRLGYLIFYDFLHFMKEPWIFFKFWDGGISGMSSHGGILGVAVVLLWFSKKYGYSIFFLGDILGTVATPGLFFGRIANFVNGELWGRVTDVSWAVIFPNSMPGTPLALISPRHPSQLYEAILEGLIPFVYLQWRFWRTRVIKERPGQLIGEFFILYSVARIVVECFREPDAALIIGLTRGQFYSLFSLIFGLYLVLRARWKAV